MIKWISKLDRRTKLYAVIGGFLFALMEVIGLKFSIVRDSTVHKAEWIRRYGDCSFGVGLILVLICTVIFAMLIAFLFNRIANHEAGQKNNQLEAETSVGIKSKTRFEIILWLGIWLLLFLCWMPSLMACYPGFYNYDAQGQLGQAMYDSVSYNSHHPILHTIIMGKIITFGYNHWGQNLNMGILCFSLFQMVVCAGVLTAVISFIWKRVHKKWICAVIFLYDALMPTVVLFAMSTTKDVLFSVALFILLLFTFQLFSDSTAFWQNKWLIAGYVVNMVFMCMMRNNGIYAFVLMAFFALCYVKEYRIKNGVLFFSCIVLYFFLNFVLLTGLHAEKGGAAEMFSVPMQQIARVYVEKGSGAFTEDQQTLLYDVISPESLLQYEAEMADPIKAAVNFNRVEANKMKYLGLWAQTGLKYPLIYISATISNTYQAWYPGTSIKYKRYSSKMQYFRFEEIDGVEMQSKILGLNHFYKEISEGSWYQRVPVVRLLFSVGAMFWVACLVLLYGLWDRNKAVVVPMILVLALCMTNWLGPVVLVRYYLILFHGFPLFLCFFHSSFSNPERIKK